MTKPFVYLVQGRSDLVEPFRHLADRFRADAYFLTYDKPIADTAIYLPNSTWTEGRNRLLEEARSSAEDYTYYIFCDDDVQFDKGDWDVWEAQLLRYVPAVAIPILPKMSRATKPFQTLGFRYQAFLDNDEMFIAFHKEVVADGIVLPYQTRFDHLNWWAACRIQQILIQNIYPKSSMQFNAVSAFDTMIERYDALDRTFRAEVAAWLEQQFAKPYREKGHGGRIGRAFNILRRTLAFALRGHTRKPSYTLDEKKAAELFAPASDLLVQYRARPATVLHKAHAEL